MLRILRPRDVDAALDATRIVEEVWQQDGSLIMRVQADCQDGRCMTVLARVTFEAVIPELILNAGKSFHLHDAAFPLWGSDRPVWWFVFEGRDGTRLIAGSRDGRWVVGAEPSDQPPADRSGVGLRAPSPTASGETSRRQSGSEP